MTKNRNSFWKKKMILQWFWFGPIGVKKVIRKFMITRIAFEICFEESSRRAFQNVTFFSNFGQILTHFLTHLIDGQRHFVICSWKKYFSLSRTTIFFFTLISRKKLSYFFLPSISTAAKGVSLCKISSTLISFVVLRLFSLISTTESFSNCWVHGLSGNFSFVYPKIFEKIFQNFWFVKLLKLLYLPFLALLNTEACLAILILQRSRSFCFISDFPM